MSNGKTSQTPNAATQADEIELVLEDSLAQRLRGLPVRQQDRSGGYNPYDAAPAGSSAQARHRPTDLRKLSEWIRLRREVEALQRPAKRDTDQEE